MKKQILFLTMLIAAVLAGTTSVFAQTIDKNVLDAEPGTCPKPAALANCGVGDPLHPIAGVDYVYTIDHDGEAGSVVHWFVATDATPFITGNAVTATIDANGGTGNYILDATAAAYNHGYGDASPNTSNTITVSWKAFDGSTNNVALVAFVTDVNGCADNIQAWKIEPDYSFVIEIAGIMQDGTFNYGAGNTNANECVSPVQSADWDGSAITMDYGDNYVFYNVTAANFIHGWMPSFTPSIVGGTSSLGTVEWAYAHEANDPTKWHPATDPVLAAQYASVVNDAIGEDGACIVLRLLVTHGAAEVALTDEQVSVAVDGDMYNSAANGYDGSYPDLDDAANSGDPCEVGSNDVGIYDITKRPNITPNTPALPFITKN